MSAADEVRRVPHWAMLGGGSLESVRREVARVESLGVQGVLVPQVYAPPWATLAAAAACSDLQLASGVAMAFVRSPFETAMAALDLDRLSGGRFTLGLGTSVRTWNEQRFGVAYDHPVERLRELVVLVRRLVTAGEQAGVGRFGGRFWHADLRGTPMPRPVRPTIPIALAPLRRRMVALSAEVGDVVLGHPMWSPRWITGAVRSAVDQGLEAGGRERSAVKVLAMLRVAITDHHEQGVRDAKAGIPFYASLQQYDSYFVEAGLAEDARRLQSLAAGGAPPADLAEAVSDALAEELVIVGTAGEVADRVAGLLGVVDELCLTPPTGLPPGPTAEYAAAIAEHLLPGAA